MTTITNKKYNNQEEDVTTEDIISLLNSSLLKKRQAKQKLEFLRVEFSKNSNPNYDFELTMSINKNIEKLKSDIDFILRIKSKLLTVINKRQLES